MTELPELPADWSSQGWTAEQAYKQDEENHSSWGESGPLEQAPDPSSVQHEEHN